MTTRTARAFAERIHGQTLDRYGLPLMNHVHRVAAGVPAEAKSVAWLHEVMEYSDVSRSQLLLAGASEDEVAAVELLTRYAGDEQEYDEHIRAIADAPGRSGDLARIVKRADLVDRIQHQDGGNDPVGPSRPSYQAALDRLTPRATTRERCAPPA